MKKLFYILFASLICSAAFCQIQPGIPKDKRDMPKYNTDTTKTKTKIDSLKIKSDSLKAKKDSLGIKKDTVMENKFAANYYLDYSFASVKLDREQILLSDYYSFSDLLQNISGYFVSDLGNPGQLNPAFYQGVSSKNTSIMIDGIPYNNSFFGIPDQSLVMTEDIEKIEVLPVSQSLLYGNSNTINIITNKKNSNHPYTYVRHIEAPYDTYMTDGVFMRNISTRSNLLVGFNYQTSLGRFDNSDFTFFGGRIRYRYILSDKMELNVSDYFTKNERGINGGVKLTNTEDDFNGDAATVVYPNSKEEYNRNLLSAQLSAFFFGDSLNSTLVTFSYNSENDKLTDEYTINSIDTILQRPIKTGSLFFSLKQRFALPTHDLSLYLSASKKSTDDFTVAGFYSDFYLINNMNDYEYNFSIYDRISIYKTFKINVGINLPFSDKKYYHPLSDKLSLSINPEIRIQNLTLSAEAAYICRGSNSYEKYVSGVYDWESHSTPEQQVHFSLTSLYKDSTNQIGLTVFCKPMTDIYLPGTYYNDKIIETPFPIDVGSPTIFGFSANCNIEYGKFLFESKIEYNHYEDTKILSRAIPELFGFAGIYYYNRIFTDDIKIKIGINAKYYSSIADLPGKISFARYITDNYSLARDYLPKGILNLFAALKIQTATVYLGIDNILDRNYFITRVYPQNDRSFKLAVSWAFWD